MHLAIKLHKLDGSVIGEGVTQKKLEKLSSGVVAGGLVREAELSSALICPCR